ncbi:replicase polyprotein [Acrasis kona]|uniref:Replicase polyprotein n=1 Tax=Acrasis kona TaxID=1008807 RepID=A0AAW2Z049_9EUKA
MGRGGAYVISNNTMFTLEKVDHHIRHMNQFDMDDKIYPNSSSNRNYLEFYYDNWSSDKRPYGLAKYKVLQNNVELGHVSLEGNNTNDLSVKVECKFLDEVGGNFFYWNNEEPSRGTAYIHLNFKRNQMVINDQFEDTLNK